MIHCVEVSNLISIVLRVLFLVCGQVLEEFSDEERSMFLRFCWGRSRLPLRADAFPQRFKLQNFSRTPADNYLPVSHTCFFSLELPAYSSLEVMKQKLTYAIYNCQAIDGDDTSVGMQAASMGWEED
jgi:E3 ubiquitin-protein ligase HERC2